MHDPNSSVKLPHEALQEFLSESQSGRECSVIVEIDVPEPQVELIRDFRRPRPVRVGTPTPAEEAETRRRLTQAQEFLTKILGKPPLPLRTAHAFVATVTPVQLLSIIQSPLTRAVRPNRTLRSPFPEAQPRLQSDELLRKLNSSVPRRVEQGLEGLRKHLESGGILSHDAWMKVAALLHGSSVPDTRAGCVDVFRLGKKDGPHQQLLRYWLETKPNEVRLQQALLAYFRDVEKAFMYLLASIRHRQLPRYVGEGVLQLLQTKLNEDHQSGGEELDDAELETIAMTADSLQDHNPPVANQIHFQITKRHLY